MNASIKLLSKIVDLFSIWKSENNDNNKFKNGRKMLMKTATSVKDHCVLYICTKFQVDISKKYRVFIFGMLKLATFHTAYWDSCTFPIFKHGLILAAQEEF